MAFGFIFLMAWTSLRCDVCFAKQDHLPESSSEQGVPLAIGCKSRLRWPPVSTAGYWLLAARLQWRWCQQSVFGRTIGLSLLRICSHSPQSATAAPHFIASLTSRASARDARKARNLIVQIVPSSVSASAAQYSYATRTLPYLRFYLTAGSSLIVANYLYTGTRR